MMTEDLTKFRKEIDAIDDEIIALLRKRVAIVHEVGKYKNKAAAGSRLSFIRPGREATMLRNLAKKGEDVLPKEAIATIWRTIISSSLCIEQDMNIAVYAPEEKQDCYWLAREYYGSFVKTESFQHTDDVIQAVARHDAAVGILPLDICGHHTPWWVRPNNEKNDIFIFARIPFSNKAGEQHPSALAIANIMPESTQEDVSVIAVYAMLSADEVIERFAARGLGVKIISAQNGNYLLESASFLNSSDERLEKVGEILGSTATVRLLGAYAVPMTI